jgi:hypothetical protein
MVVADGGRVEYEHRESGKTSEIWTGAIELVCTTTTTTVLVC